MAPASQAHAKGVGNPVFYVGAETGRDGLAGAAFASRELTEESKEDRPAVQVGDPFTEKVLIECCLEIFAEDIIVGIDAADRFIIDNNANQYTNVSAPDLPDEQYYFAVH